MFYVFCALLYVHSGFAIILMGKRELAVLLSWSSWCLVSIVWLFHAVPWLCLKFVILTPPPLEKLGTPLDFSGGPSVCSMENVESLSKRTNFFERT